MGLKFFFSISSTSFFPSFWREYSKKLKTLMLVHLPGLNTAPPSRADRPWQTFSMVKSCCLLYRVSGRITWVAECKELSAVPATLWVLHYSLHICCQICREKMFMVAICSDESVYQYEITLFVPYGSFCLEFYVSYMATMLSFLYFPDLSWGSWVGGVTPFKKKPWNF